MDKEKKKAVLLINLGTPEAPTEEAVREYLREFLSDPRVVTIPRFIWWFILKFFVLRQRPKLSAKAYQKVWTEEGSPLMVNSKKVCVKLQQLSNQKAPGQYEFFLSMRYGKPSIQNVLEDIKNHKLENLIVLPLYPQFAASSTGTALHAFDQALNKSNGAIQSSVIHDYHDNDVYITSLANSIQKHWLAHGQGDCLLMSFHGVPERTIQQGDPYYSHCKKTAELLAGKLGLSTKQWRLVFQSRFGRAKWVQPYCIEILQNLPNQGVNNIDIVCPGFAVDCLETLEEIALQNKNVFLKAGGEQYQYIPALNDSDEHINTLFSLVNDSSLRE